MKLKKIILGLAALAFMAIQTASFADQVSDSTIKLLVSKYKAQNYLGCIQASDKVIQKNPSNIFAYYYKGLSYYQLGKKEEAISAFEKVQALNSNKTLVEYSKKGIACLENPEECATYGQAQSDLDLFIKSKKFYDKSVQAEVNKKKLDRIRENINDELKNTDQKSEVPTNDEIANAVKTLAKIGINPLAGINAGYQNPEMMQMNMLLGNNNMNNGMGMNNNMLPMLLMNKEAMQNMSPEVIQSMMMNQMAPAF